MTDPYLQRLGQALDVVGPQQGHVAHWFATVPFPSDASYAHFLSLLAGPPPAGTP